ncbi:glucose-6-phosphate dehydrogenase [Candidatus Pacebacteria bacterium]|nr:glucose-6-phosphate dehydrogenase [Candidatus Paceibacterota bacterium]
MQTESAVQIVILGGTGDLAVRKLLPALYQLYIHKKLPSKFSILGSAKENFSHEAYQTFVAEAFSVYAHKHTKRKLAQFCKHLHYVGGDFSNNALYTSLTNELAAYDNHIEAATNKLYYLAVPPSHYTAILSKIKKHKLHLTCDKNTGWARVLIEKPFGSDFRSAQKLDRKLGKLFKEEQIYRIDHYLAKEAVQNILSFRFSNTLMRGVWNKSNIERVEIAMHELLTVEGRGAFYDKIGAVRDVGQNHLLQLVALLTMDEPKFFEPDHIRAARAKALQCLKQQSANSIHDHFARAQYAGYKKAKGVADSSTTETYFDLKLFSRHKDWRGVPIFITAGKALNEARVEVKVFFKDNAAGLFETESCKVTENVVTLTISPRQAMHITLNAKLPGLRYQLQERTLSFDCPLGDKEITNSYEKVLRDCIIGDQTLFATTKEVLAQWRYINSILRSRHIVPLQTYRKGSRGPKHILRRANIE